MSTPPPKKETAASFELKAGSNPIRRTERSRETVSGFRGVDDPAQFARSLQSWRQAVTDHQQLPRYRMVERLGQGSQGLVYSVADRDCMREVALKTLHSHQCAPDDVSRFIHEAQVTAQLEHPGIVPVHDLDVLPDGTLIYTMKKVEGQNLAELLGYNSGAKEGAPKVERPRPGVDELLQIIVKVCDTVAFAHSRGVIHRDLKLRNLMIGRYGEVLVMDWGLAKVLSKQSKPAASGARQIHSLRSIPVEDGSDIHQTIHGSSIGTPAYMSPEQARGEPADQRSDIYCLGVVLYTCLSGESPYQRGRIRYTMDQAASGQWRRLDHQERCRKLSKRLIAIVHKCMAFDPYDRYQNVDALVLDLRAFMAGHAVGAYRDSVLEMGLRFFSQQRLGLAIFGALMVVFSAAVGLWRWQQETLHEEQLQKLRQSSAQHELMGELDKARSDLDQILAGNPDDPRARDGLLRLRQAMDRRSEEQLSLRKRQGAAGLVREALRFIAIGDNESLHRATECYLKALGLMPDDPAIVRDYQRITALIAQREEQALSLARATYQASRASEFSLRSAEAEATGDMRMAISLLEAALQLDPSDARTRRHATLVAHAAELDHLAEVRARQAEASALIGTCRAAIAQGDRVAARGCYERAHGIDSEHPELPDLRAQVLGLEQAEDEAQAQAILAQAQPHLAQARKLSGQLEDAAADASLGAQRAAALGAGLRLLYRAQAIAPGSLMVRAALGAYYRARLADHDELGLAEDEPLAEAAAYDDGSQADALAGIAELEVHGAEVSCVRQLDVSSSTRVQIADGTSSKLRFGAWVVTDAAGHCSHLRLRRGQKLTLSWLPDFPDRLILVPANQAFVGGESCAVPAFLASMPITEAEFTMALTAEQHVPSTAVPASAVPATGLTEAQIRAYVAARTRREGLPWRLPSIAEVRVMAEIREPEIACATDGSLVVLIDDRHFLRWSATTPHSGARFRVVRELASSTR
jgi:tetratricopeptide (TPR) repeat protein